jgi:hypothetical protein
MIPSKALIDYAEVMQVMERGRTRKVDEGQVSDVLAADLEAHAVLRERKLALLWVLVLALQELLRLRSRVENGTLGAPDALLDVGLLEDRRPEAFGPGLAQRGALSVCDGANRHDALPRLLRMSQPAFGRAPSTASDTETTIRRFDTHRVQVPLARGRVMPEIDSISEDYTRVRMSFRTRKVEEDFYLASALATNDRNDGEVDVDLHAVSADSAQLAHGLHKNGTG